MEDLRTAHKCGGGGREEGGLLVLKSFFQVWRGGLFTAGLLETNINSKCSFTIGIRGCIIIDEKNHFSNGKLELARVLGGSL